MNYLKDPDQTKHPKEWMQGNKNDNHNKNFAKQN